MSDRSRRAILGASGTALATALAGCNDILGGGNGTPTGTPTDGGEGGGAEPGGNATAAGTETSGGAATPGQQTPVGGPQAIENWLTGTSYGGSAGNYDGSIADRLGQDQVTIRVGAQGNGGNRAFAPPAVAVSDGTEIRWEWTGQGGPHNVTTAPEERSPTAYEFSSGEPESGGDVTYARTVGELGALLYHCEPHLDAGMKGGILVQ